MLHDDAAVVSISPYVRTDELGSMGVGRIFSRGEIVYFLWGDERIFIREGKTLVKLHFTNLKLGQNIFY